MEFCLLWDLCIEMKDMCRLLISFKFRVVKREIKTNQQ